MKGLEGAETLRLQGKIQRFKVLILVDSGSSTSFVSQELANKLTGSIPLAKPTMVRIANGGILQGSVIFPDCPWFCQGSKFCTSFRALPLDCYDVILGIDWLKLHSPMSVDWTAKWLRIPHNGTQVTLKGIQPDTQKCPPISTKQLQNWEMIDDVVHCLLVCFVADLPESACIPAMQPLLQQFSELFEKPKGLPPQRPFDHAIPLLPGAQPVNVRPYRYNPEQKNEIEKQVADMLANGIITPSCSPFASPVLLVAKKDFTWRLCGDYRHLNAITVKNKYPIPVVDELLNELASSRFFTSLDLRSGYQQIHMKVEDQHKTAFQTHHGHFEYKVMPYGLTGGPATF